MGLGVLPARRPCLLPALQPGALAPAAGVHRPGPQQARRVCRGVILKGTSLLLCLARRAPARPGRSWDMAAADTQSPCASVCPRRGPPPVPTGRAPGCSPSPRPTTMKATCTRRSRWPQGKGTGQPCPGAPQDSASFHPLSSNHSPHTHPCLSDSPQSPGQRRPGLPACAAVGAAPLLGTQLPTAGMAWVGHAENTEGPVLSASSQEASASQLSASGREGPQKCLWSQTRVTFHPVCATCGL